MIVSTICIHWHQTGTICNWFPHIHYMRFRLFMPKKIEHTNFEIGKSGLCRCSSFPSRDDVDDTFYLYSASGMKGNGSQPLQLCTIQAFNSLHCTRMRALATLFLRVFKILYLFCSYLTSDSCIEFHSSMIFAQLIFMFAVM